jgi:CRISPR-associated protein (TIGR03986 family)
MSIDRIRAPYGFVPLSSQVVWGDPDVSHDHPYEEGLCGTFELLVEAETPIFVRGAGEREKFFTAPDGVRAIPGSSLRGALRNVVEIATFSKMSRVNDHRYAIRDLHNQELYVRHLAGLMLDPDGRNRPMPKVEAGWLVRAPASAGENAPVATIQPCHFAKIEYRRLLAIAKDFGIQRYAPGRRQAAPDKYRAWGRRRGVFVDIRRLRPLSKSYSTEFGEVVGPGTRSGTLVFTGQPSPWDPHAAPRRHGAGQPKHHDFVFHDALGVPAIEVSRKQMEDFEFVHSARTDLPEALGEERAKRGQQGALRQSEAPNPEWGFWKPHFEGREGAFFGDARVPVFFLRNGDGSLRAFGLAMMFRLAYDQSTWDAVTNAQPDAAVAERLDFAETLFGNVRRDPRPEGDADREGALKGRISFGLAKAQGQPTELSAVRAVLAVPKASYYPSYLEQRVGVHGGSPERVGGKPQYRTYMDPDVRVRGWKRYRPLLEHVDKPPLPTKGDGSALETGKVETVFSPLGPGTVFRGRVRVHNVRPAELGAILWALDFGGDPHARHQLGLARPLGYGRVRLTHTSWQVEDMQDRPVDPASCIEAFRRAMESQISGWASSPQLRELVALARPIPREDGRHMQINHPQWRNEFQAAKLAGLALPPASALGPSERAAPVRTDRPTPEKKKPWTGMRGGTKVRVRLLELNRKNKWRAELVEHAARGVLEGTPPAGAEAGQEHEAIVVSGGDPTNLNLRWP